MSICQKGKFLYPDNSFAPVTKPLYDVTITYWKISNVFTYFNLQSKFKDITLIDRLFLFKYIMCKNKTAELSDLEKIKQNCSCT